MPSLSTGAIYDVCHTMSMIYVIETGAGGGHVHGNGYGWLPAHNFFI